MSAARAVPAAIVVGILAVAGMNVLAGVEMPWAVLLGVPVTAFTLLFLVTPGAAEPIWAPLPDPSARATVHVATSLASRLQEAADYPSRFRNRIQPRLGRLALAKLHRAGIEELHDPRAPEVLGDEVYRLVTDPNATMPDPRTAAVLFATLERA